VRRRLLTRWYVMAGRAACGPLYGRPPTGKIRVPTRADTSGEASRRWRTSTSTSSAMASPPLLLALGLRGRLENSLAEHVPGLLHSPCANGVQRRPQPGAGRHFVGARLMEVEVEPVVRGTDSERRPVWPFLYQEPLDGLVRVALARMARAAGVEWSPSARLFPDPFGRYSGGLGDGGPLRVAAHGLKGQQHRLMALHLETDLHGPSLLHRRADQLRHLAPVVGTDDVVAAPLVPQRPLALVLKRAYLEHDLRHEPGHVRRVELALPHRPPVGEHLPGRLDLPHLARERVLLQRP